MVMVNELFLAKNYSGDNINLCSYIIDEKSEEIVPEKFHMQHIDASSFYHPWDKRFA
jgi:hypothetical protein